MRFKPIALAVALAALLAAPASMAEEAAFEGTITVVARDESGAALPNAKVTCVEVDFESLRLAPLRPAEMKKTDAKGNAVFSGLSRSTYYVFARTDRLGAFGRVDFNDSHEETLELTLELGRSIRGRIVNESGRPIAGVRALRQEYLEVARSDDEGYVVLPNLPPGHTQFVFVCEGFAPVKENVRSATQEFQIIMTPGGKVSGTVTGPNGQTVAGAAISAYPFRTESDEDGHFELGWFPTGQKVQVHANNNDNENWLAGRAEVMVESADNQLTLQLTKPEPQTGETVTGMVIMAKTGEPVESRVFAGYNLRDFYESISKKAQSGSDGQFTLENLYPGTLYVAVHPDDPALYCLEGIVRVDLKDESREAANLVFTVAQGSAIKGVVRRQDGSPPDRLWVYLLPMLDKSNFYTDKSGAFEIPNLPPSDTVYTLKANNETGEEASIEVGPLDVGEVAEVTFELPPPTMTSRVQGIVVDTKGNPVPGATLSLRITERDTGNVTSTSTDDAGQFDWEIQGSAQGDVNVYMSRQLQIGSSVINAGPDVEVKDGGSLAVEEGQTVTGHRIVVALTPQPYLTGFVVDEQGNPVEASLDVLTDTTNHARAYLDKARFAIIKLPDKPYVIEVTAPGFQARILEPAKDFEPGAMDSQVVLEGGPFPENASVWAEVTGRDPVEAEIDAIPGGRIIWQRCQQMYPQLAAQVPDSERPTPSPSPQPVPKVQTTVVTEDGTPVQRIVLPGRIYPMQFMPDYGYIEAHMMSPYDQASEIRTSDDGIYELYPGALFYAEGSAYAMAPGLNYRDYGLTPPETATITLYPASKLTLRIVDAAGNPMEGVAAGLTTVSTQSLDVFPKTNASGEVTFERFGPGAYSFRVEEAPVYDAVEQAWETPTSAPTVVRIVVEPGKDLRETVQLGGEPGTGEALLTQWYDYGQRRITAPGATVKRAGKKAVAVAAAVAQRLNALSGQGHWEQRYLEQFLEVIEKLQMTETAPALENLILRLEDSDNPYLQPLRVEPILTTITAVKGGKSLPFLQSLAADAGRPASVRREAILSLSNFGTDAAVDAYKRLLADAATGAGAADPAKAESEGEAIKRTLHLVFDVIPTGDPNASSSEIMGDIRIRDHDKAEVIHGGKIIHLDFRDGVWLIASVVPMPIP